MFVRLVSEGFAYYLIFIVSTALNFPNQLLAHSRCEASSEKVIEAIRVNSTTPTIDGILDENIWKFAPRFTGFTQLEPNEGGAPTEDTTVQIVFDDDALYIGIMAYDSKPEEIVSRLARRDQINESDAVEIIVDSHHDHQTAYAFSTNAAGVLRDGYNDNEGDWDSTWDSVWEASSALHSQGWSAEIRLPYNVLRFSPQKQYTWGINIIRYISRKKEKIYWVIVPSRQSGWVSRFGHLEGIEGIKPRAHLALLPYAVARSTFGHGSQINSGDRALFLNLGGDLRYGFAPNISLNVAANPDFGQVEADPAVLNLSVFETFFEERRPFFVEGAQIFETPLQLFHSRRIGRQPGHISTPSGYEVMDRPEFTNVFGAAKVTGKTLGKTTFGLVEAVTSAEHAIIETTYTDLATGLERTRRSNYRVEPLANYFVGRVQKDILKGSSNVGLLTTAVHRDNSGSAYAGGIDWHLNRWNNSYLLWGQAAGSQINPSDGREEKGYATKLGLTKQGGWTRANIGFTILSPRFNINDLGFIGRANRISFESSLNFRKDQPWSLFRRMDLDLYQWTNRNYNGETLENGMGFDTSLVIYN